LCSMVSCCCCILLPIVSARHVLESKSQGALAIPAVFLHQELPIRLSHALKMLNSNMLPINMQDMPNFQQIARSYLEDIR